MSRRITVTMNTMSLAFSPDGKHLAAGLGEGGLRVYERSKAWAEVFRDEDYNSAIYGIAFAADGRLATSSLDRKIRLYNSSFRRLETKSASGGSRPLGLAFSPEGAILAVGYDDIPSVDLLDGRTLARLPSPNVDGLDNGSVSSVAWSRDGRTLFAGGQYCDGSGCPVVAWADAGRGERRSLRAGDNTISGLKVLPKGRLAVATQDPSVAVLGADGSRIWERGPPKADFRYQRSSLAVSADGTIVDFGFEFGGASPLRFTLDKLELKAEWPADDRTRCQSRKGLPSRIGATPFGPTLDGKPIELEPYEISRSLAIHPDRTRFVLGTEYSLRALDANGEALWTRQVPSIVWAVNISADGRLVVAAYDDGTIRWHRMDDGRELMALMVLADRKNWVAWTPEGFYAATPAAHGVLKWHVNRGSDAAAETVPVSQIPLLRRPDALALVLQEMETARALGIADLAAARAAVQRATGMSAAPGANLHVLAIGVSDYGEKAKQLNLKFADKDVRDVANALLNTQDGSLNKAGSVYSEVKPILLMNETASKPDIFEAFASIQRSMSGAGNDMAVVMFSGHAAIVDNQLYLLPYGVDAGTPARVKATALLASEFQAEVARLAEHGRVLVLLDACHSGAVTNDGSRLTANADLMRTLISRNNVTVLTSSTAEQPSREDEKWGNGAFTKVFLDALGRAADDDHNGMISMGELAGYVAINLPLLTEGKQHPGIEQRFLSDIFVAGL